LHRRMATNNPLGMELRWTATSCLSKALNTSSPTQSCLVRIVYHLSRKLSIHLQFIFV
jgi:hypothetical protein